MDFELSRIYLGILVQVPKIHDLMDIESYSDNVVTSPSYLEL